MNQQSPRVRPRRGSRAKSFLIGLVIGLVCAIIAYAVGLGKGKAGTRAAEARAQQAEQKVAPLEATVQLLQARGLISRAAQELEARNFGSAEASVQSAAKILATPPPGADAERIAAIRSQLEGTTLSVSDNVGTQRERLMDLARQMDTVLPPLPTPAEPAPAAESEQTPPG